jgi:hypothetical protein
MKTAMQELIEWYQREHFVKTTFHIQLLNKFESLLEKEKEQMFDFFLKGYSIGESDFNPKSEANKYYNQTYKQEIEKL